MNAKWFTNNFGQKLLITFKRSCVEFYGKGDSFDYTGTDAVKFLKDNAVKNWKTFTPRDATSCESDYGFGTFFPEDGNDWAIGLKGTTFCFENPEKTDLHYRFTKRQLETLIYDLEGR